MRPHSIPPRRPIFIGVEGTSEKSFIRFLQSCCDAAGLHVHTVVVVAGGGDTVCVVEEAHRSLIRNRTKREFHDRIVLLDRDRVARDQQSGRDAKAVAARLGLEAVFEEPNFEGLLVRLHREYEGLNLAPGRVDEYLKRVWPTYRKPQSAKSLTDRFSVADLRRAAKHDGQLRRLLRILGL